MAQLWKKARKFCIASQKQTLQKSRHNMGSRNVRLSIEGHELG